MHTYVLRWLVPNDEGRMVGYELAMEATGLPAANRALSALVLGLAATGVPAFKFDVFRTNKDRDLMVVQKEAW